MGWFADRKFQHELASAIPSDSPPPRPLLNLHRNVSLCGARFIHPFCSCPPPQPTCVTIGIQCAFPRHILSDNQKTRNLGIDDVYFESQSVETVADHILALYGAKIFAFIRSEHVLDINLERETEDGAVYVHTSKPGVSTLMGPQHERR